MAPTMNARLDRSKGEWIEAYFSRRQEAQGENSGASERGKSDLLPDQGSLSVFLLNAGPRQQRENDISLTAAGPFLIVVLDGSGIIAFSARSVFRRPPNTARPRFSVAFTHFCNNAVKRRDIAHELLEWLRELICSEDTDLCGSDFNMPGNVVSPCAFAIPECGGTYTNTVRRAQPRAGGCGPNGPSCAFPCLHSSGGVALTSRTQGTKRKSHGQAQRAPKRP